MGPRVLATGVPPGHRQRRASRSGEQRLSGGGVFFQTFRVDRSAGISAYAGPFIKIIPRRT